MQKLTRIEAAEIIERFLQGKGSAYDWDDFVSVRAGDPEIETIRDECERIPERYPPNRPTEYCNEAGTARLAELARQLRS